MRLYFSLPDELGAEVRSWARERGVSVSRYLTDLLTDDYRRRALHAWSEEILAMSPPTEADLDEVEAFLSRARRREVIEHIERLTAARRAQEAESPCGGRAGAS